MVEIAIYRSSTRNDDNDDNDDDKNNILIKSQRPLFLIDDLSFAASHCAICLIYLRKFGSISQLVILLCSTIHLEQYFGLQFC